MIVPYTGPDLSGTAEDVFLYLRPESNGVLVESILMGVLRGTPLFRENAKLVYLANLPGDFIIENHVVEDHYSVNYRFACRGRELFTSHMKSAFKEHFKIEFEKAEVLGSFEALKRLNMDEEKLFNIWVSDKDMMQINGQSIKKYDNLYIINYDIPALMHKNNYSTDIAVMILRSSLEKDAFHDMVISMEHALIEKGLMDRDKPSSRYFHYSKGPFEQILDGLGYLYNPEGKHLPFENLSFTKKLLSAGYSMDEIQGFISNPIMCFKENDVFVEDNLFLRTRHNTSGEAMDVLGSMRCQIYLK